MGSKTSLRTHCDSSVDQKPLSRLRGLCKQQLMDSLGLETVEVVPSRQATFTPTTSYIQS